MGEPQRPHRHWLRWFLVVLVILVVLASVRSHDNTSSQTPAAGGTARSGPPSVVFNSFHVGDCVNWNQYVGDAPPHVVPCTTSHIFQVTGSTEMPGDQFPKADQWQALVSLGQCYSLAITWLGGQPEPVGKFNVVTLKPTRQGWTQGDHTAWCGVAITSPHSSIWAPSTGSAEGSG